MQIGVTFPQTEIGSDVGAIRAFAEGVDGMGFGHLLAFDHVLGADPAVHPGWDGVYDVDTTFHEPMVLFGYLAAITSLELVTGVLILAQRQTALVAKQAAQVDILTNGHLRLGVGVGWNAVEYDALGKQFTTRGRRTDRQVELLRRLWTERTVSQRFDDENVNGAGINPLPVQRPIPVWFGGHTPAAYRRIGRLGDGWFPQVLPGPELDEARSIIEAEAGATGRDIANLGMEGAVRWRGDAPAIVKHAAKWRGAGATHLTINTMGAGLVGANPHLQAVAAAADALGVTPR